MKDIGYTVASAIITDSGKVALKESYNGWSLPGGFISGYGVLDALSKRLKEEHNLSFEPLHINGVYQNFTSRGIWITNICVNASLTSSKDSLKNIGWFTPEEIYSELKVRTQDTLYALDDLMTDVHIPLSFLRSTYKPIEGTGLASSQIVPPDEMTVNGTVIRDPEGMYWLMESAKHGGLSLIGGKAMPGESFKACTIREAYEEAGIKVRPIGLAGIFVNRISHKHGNGYVTNVASFALTNETESRVPDDRTHEVASLKRYTLEDIKRLNDERPSIFRTPDTPLAVIIADNLSRNAGLYPLDLIVNLEDNEGPFNS